MSAENPQPIEVSIVARIQSLLDGMAQSTSAVKTGTMEMGNALGGLGSTVSNLATPFLALTGILAGGAMFKSAVDETIKWNGEAIKLAATLGITTEQASILNVALGDIYTTSDDFLRAANMMTRQINSGADGFKKLGVDVKDAHGNLKPTGELMTEVIDKLGSMEQGTNRNAAGMAIFGRGWGEASKLLKLNTEVMEEAKKKAEALNLIVGGDAVEAQKRYKASMNDVDDAFLGMKLAVGQQLLPQLGNLAEMFGSILPPIVTALGAVMKGIITAFYTLKFVIEAVVAYAMDFFLKAVEGAKGLGAVINKLVHGDFKGAAEAFKDTNRNIEAISKETSSIVGDAYDDLGKKLVKIWDGGGTGATKVGKQGSDQFNPDKGKDASDDILKRFKLQLEQMKDAEQNWFTWSDARELAFWQEKLQHVEKGSKAYLAVLTEENKLRRKIAEEEQAKLKVDFETRLEAQKFNSEARVSMALQEADRIANVYGFESKQFAEAMKKVEEERQKHNERMRQLAQARTENDRENQLAMVALNEEFTRRAASIGTISREQELQQLRMFEMQRYQIALKAAQDMARLEMDPVKKQEQLNRIEQLERQHNQRMAQMDTQAIQLKRQQWDNWFSGLTNGFNGAITGLINGTKTWGDAFKSILGSMQDFLIQTSINMAMKWVSDRLFELAFGKSTRSAEVMGASSVYAVNAMASVAAIPVTGWAMAPGVGASAFASGLSFLPSAAQGWDRVPQDTLAAIHKDEMVMSAPLAQGLRELIAGGGARASQPVNHYTIHAMDGADVERVLMRHRGALAKVNKTLIRDGRMG